MSYLGSALIIFGYLLVTRVNLLGFGVQVLGCLIFIVLYWSVDWAIVITNSVFIGVNIYGFIHWGRNAGTLG